MSRHPRPNPAMVEDLDEDDRVIEGSGHYARSNAMMSPPGSPLRQQMNTSKKKSSRRSHDHSISPPEYDLESDLPSPGPRPSRRDSKTEKKRSSMGGSKGKAVVLKEDRPRRPTTRTAKTAPGPPPRGLSDEASYYGIPSQTIIPSHSRPRAATARPASYYGTSARPPLSHSAYYGGAPALGTSFPPPAWNGGPGMPPMGPPQMMAQSPLSGPPVDYFSNNARPADTLAARFSRQGEPRPRSSLGFRGPPSAYEDYEHSQVMETPPMRHASLTRRPKKDQDERDRNRMPPPPRPQTTKPADRLVFRPPQQPRKSAHFLEEELETEGDDDLYQSAPGHPEAFEYGTAMVPSRARRTSIDSEDYEDGVFTLEPAGHNRRHSSYNFEDKMKQATSYQNDVTGGPTAPLTAETLRRVKNSGTSRSSRSTQSRDESSYKQSATTRTTRSSSADDDITIKVPDGAVVEVGNTKISCGKGGRNDDRPQYWRKRSRHGLRR
ncbi:hypothetical protein PG999_011597 [Apiospora kogelbergensis]|uniref:Uncharacterized protein n=1 Tax=Apiospora kogelbergensis TaxID=1337665 RepID=A0AAW0QDL6_9PEZI